MPRIVKNSRSTINSLIWYPRRELHSDARGHAGLNRTRLLFRHGGIEVVRKVGFEPTNVRGFKSLAYADSATSA
jgi:hypothetical protein